MCSSLESGNRKWETNKCINVQQKGHLTSSIFTRAFNISASQRYSRRRHYLRQTATAWFKKNISIGLNEGSKSTWRGGQTWKQRTQKTGRTQINRSEKDRTVTGSPALQVSMFHIQVHQIHRSVCRPQRSRSGDSFTVWYDVDIVLLTRITGAIWPETRTKRSR